MKRIATLKNPIFANWILNVVGAIIFFQHPQQQQKITPRLMVFYILSIIIHQYLSLTPQRLQNIR